MTHVVEYKIYKNILTYLDIINATPVKDVDVLEKSSTEKVVKDDTKYTIKSNSDIVKTLQFYSYIRIKTKLSDESIMYVYIVRDSDIVSKSTLFKSTILNTIPEKEFKLTIVSKIGIKTQVLKFIRKYKNKTVGIRNFMYDLFKTDLRGNVRVPKHTLCTDAEKKQIMIDNFITSESNFPRIGRSDAQVLWLGGEPGQLVRILRHDVTGPVVYYRIIASK